MAGRNRIFLIALVFGAALLGPAQGKDRVSLVTKADKNRVAVGEKIVLTAVLQWIPSKDGEIRIIKVKSPQCSLLKLVNSSQTANSGLYDNKVISNQILKYVFRADEKGLEEISPVTVEYVVGKDEQKITISSDPLEIKVISLKEKFMSGPGFIAVIAAGVLAVILGIVLFLKKRKDKQSPAGLKPAFGRYEREAMDKLIDITKYRLIGDFRKYYTQLHYILADYARVKYHIQIKNKSEAEIRQLSSEINIPGELLRLVIDTAQLSETVKFAGSEVNPNEERRVFTGIERYLRSMIPKEGEEKIELIKEV